jgi:tetratricopeptide (TPR) repeat protein
MKNALLRSSAVTAWLGFFGVLAAAGAPVKVWQDSIRLSTYEEREAEAEPQFSAYARNSAAYPYPVRSHLTQTRREKTWLQLNLENEYLLCRVLPELGGHLYSCRDKRNGREMFHANPVIKKAPFSMRVAWVALGVESNFPVTHSRTTVSPTDFALHTEPDGSARAVLQTIDRVTGMQWRVDYVLRPADTVLEQRVTLYNRSYARHGYLWWANAGFTLDDPATRFVLPARLVGENWFSRMDTWPIDSAGRDESLVAMHKDAMAWFAYGCREPFFAVYKPGFRSGLAHFADPDIVTGKKLWLWGSTQEATVKPQVTDNFPFYGEIQAGLFQTQEIYQFLEPEQYRMFSEYWIPVHDVGGVSRVTRDAVLNMERRTVSGARPQLLVEFSVTHPVAGAAIRLRSEGKVAFEQRLDLNPAARYEHVLQDPGQGPYTVQLADAKGSILLEHTEGRYATLAPEERQPGAAPSAGNQETEAKFVADAKYEELTEQWGKAWAHYGAGLKKFPSSIPLLKEAGILAVALHRFQDAVRLLEPVHAVDGSDEVSYAYGVALAMHERDAEARSVLSQISPSGRFGAAAALQLALLAARGKDDTAALNALQPLLSVFGGPLRAGGIEVALLRRSGRKEDASRHLSLWLRQDPADSMLRFEKTLLSKDDDAALWNHLAADAERVIALSDEYISLGMYEDALQLLANAYQPLPAEQLEPGAVPPSQSPLVAYYRAYCREQLHQPAAEDLAVAARASTTYAFPYLPSALAVLQYAIKSNPSDAKAHFLLGLFLMQGLQVDEAVAEFSKAVAIDRKQPGLERELAKAMREVNKDLLAANATVKQGSQPHSAPHPQPPRSNPPVAAAKVLPFSRTEPAVQATWLESRDLVNLASAAMMSAASGNAITAGGTFDPKRFAAEKQPAEVRRAYIEVQLHKLLAATANPDKCPEALHGRDVLGDEDKNLPFTFHGFGNFMKAAHFQYYLAMVEANCQEQKSARKRWERVSKMKESLPSAEFAFPLLAALKIHAADAKPRIAAALESVRGALSSADQETKPSLVYLEAMLLHMSGNDGEAIPKLQELVNTAAENIDVQYFARLVMREILPPK